MQNRIIKQLLNMIDYLMLDNERLKQKLIRFEKRQNAKFGGTQELRNFRKF